MFMRMRMMVTFNFTSPIFGSCHKPFHCYKMRFYAYFTNQHNMNISSKYLSLLMSYLNISKKKSYSYIRAKI